MEVYTFKKNNEICAVGVFGFPLKAQFPFFCGFGSHTDSDKAFQHAYSESLQRLAFLWGEDIPTQNPEFSPTPSFHLDYYTVPENLPKLMNWLKGGHFQHSKSSSSNHRETSPRVRFFDITPSELKSKMTVVKALSPDFLPLIFGENTHNGLFHPIA